MHDRLTELAERMHTSLGTVVRMAAHQFLESKEGEYGIEKRDKIAS